MSLSGIKRLHKTYHSGKPNQIDVLSNAELSLKEGEVVALVAPSGAGKSTLLHIAGLLDTPDSGDVILKGEMLNVKSDARRTIIRRRDIGFIYQFHHLLPEFSAAENIMIPRWQMVSRAPKPMTAQENCFLRWDWEAVSSTALRSCLEGNNKELLFVEP